MAVLADAFATTPAGYVTGIGVPIIAAIVAWLVIRLISKVDRVEQAMVVQSQALAVLVAQIAPMQIQQNKHDDAIDRLATATAVLQSEMNKHEAWATGRSSELERVSLKVGP